MATIWFMDKSKIEADEFTFQGYGVAITRTDSDGDVHHDVFPWHLVARVSWDDQ